jgi:hypothetical protein
MVEVRDMAVGVVAPLPAIGEEEELAVAGDGSSTPSSVVASGVRALNAPPPLLLGLPPELVGRAIYFAVQLRLFGVFSGALMVLWEREGLTLGDDGA